MLRTVTAEEAAARLVAVAALDQRVRGLSAAVKAQLRDLTAPGTTVRPSIDGKPVGVVTHKPGPRKAIVADAEAFAWWVREHYPGQVQLVPAAQHNPHHEGPLNMAWKSDSSCKNKCWDSRRRLGSRPAREENPATTLRQGSASSSNPAK